MKDLKFIDKKHKYIYMIDEHGTAHIVTKNKSELYEKAINGEFGKIAPYEEVERIRKYKQDIIVEKVKLKYILLKYKILYDFEHIISQMDDITKLIWNDSTYINKENELMVLLQKTVNFPDGSEITKDDINEIFIEAEKIEFM